MEMYNQEIIQALELAVFESADGEYFKSLYALPDWFHSSYPQIGSASKPIKLAQQFLFLANFLEDAKELWHKAEKGRLKSGSWIANDSHGKEYQVEATAINLDEKKVLILESGSYSDKEKEFILSKNESMAFDLKLLEAFEHQEQQIRIDMREKLEGEFQQLREENTNLRLRLKQVAEKD